MNRRCQCAAIGAALASGLGAQTATKVLPSGLGMESRFGRYAQPAPFEQAPARVQQVFAKSEIAAQSAQITSIALRGARVTAPTAGVTVKNLVVELGYSAVTPEKMTTSYNANRGSGITTVLSGRYVLPTIRPGDGPGAFQLRFPLKTPFSYAASKGPLLLDIINHDKYSYGGWRYGLDGVTASASTRIEYGTCGQIPGSGCAVFRVNLNGDAPVIGRPLSLDVLDLPKQWPVAVFFGTSRLSWNGRQLPFWLGQLGASHGSAIWASVDMLLPMTTYFRTTVPYANRWAAKLAVNVPDNAFLATRKIYVQTVVAHDHGPLPIATTSAHLVGIGKREPPTQMLFSPWTSGSGHYFGGSRGGGGPNVYGGLVVEVQGTFQ